MTDFGRKDSRRTGKYKFGRITEDLTEEYGNKKFCAGKNLRI
jgi:hypothetical protein